MISKDKYKDILNQAAASEMKKLEASYVMNTKKTKYTSVAVRGVAVAACVLLLCVGTVMAGVFTGFWSRGLDNTINGSDEQRLDLTSKGLAINLTDTDSVTVNGVTITPQAAVTDGCVGYISLKVDGYDLDEEAGWPCFQSKGDYYLTGVYEDHDYFQDMQTEGLHWFSGGDNHYGFYDGIASFSDGKYYYSDGTEALSGSDGMPKGRYRSEDGSLEYIAEVIYTEGEDKLFGKTVHFEMDDLSTASYSRNKSDDNYYTNIVKGKWVLDVTFPEESDIQAELRSFQPDREINETSCTVTEVTLSPLSAILKYSVEQEGGYLEISKIIYEDGETIELDSPYYKAASAPGIECETITALDLIAQPEKINAIEVIYYNYTYGITQTDFIELR